LEWNLWQCGARQLVTRSLHHHRHRSLYRSHRLDPVHHYQLDQAYIPVPPLTRSSTLPRWQREAQCYRRNVLPRCVASRRCGLLGRRNSEHESVRLECRQEVEGTLNVGRSQVIARAKATLNIRRTSFVFIIHYQRFQHYKRGT
jgi:hypothetical protein